MNKEPYSIQKSNGFVSVVLEDGQNLEEDLSSALWALRLTTHTTTKRATFQLTQQES